MHDMCLLISWVAPGLEPSRGGAVAGVGGRLFLLLHDWICCGRGGAPYRESHAVFKWDISGHLDVLSSLFSRLSIAPGWCHLTLPICPIYLELNAWHRPDSWYWHRCADLLRCVRSALLTIPAKPAMTVVVYGKPQAFWCLPSVQPRVIFVYLMMDQDCMPSSLLLLDFFPFDIVTWFRLGASECGHFPSHAIFHADNASRELLMLCLCFQCRGAALRGDPPVIVDALSHPPVMAVNCRGSDTRHQCLEFDSVDFAPLASFLTPRNPLKHP